MLSSHHVESQAMAFPTSTYILRPAAPSRHQIRVYPNFLISRPRTPREKALVINHCMNHSVKLLTPPSLRIWLYNQVLLRLHTRVQALEETRHRTEEERDKLYLVLRRQSRTQHGFICLDCNQEVVHACSPPIFTLLLSHPGYYPVGLQTRFTGPAIQGHPFELSATFDLSFTLHCHPKAV